MPWKGPLDENRCKAITRTFARPPCKVLCSKGPTALQGSLSAIGRRHAGLKRFASSTTLGGGALCPRGPPLGGRGRGALDV